MTDLEKVQKNIREFRKRLLTFRTSMEELGFYYNEEAIKFLENDSEIRKILLMQGKIREMENWQGMLFGDSENVIATFYEPDKKTSMMHYRLTDDNELKFINGWKVNGKNNVVSDIQMIRENNLYIVMEGTDIIGAYDYQKGEFVIDLYKVKIKDPTKEEVLAIVEYQQPIQKVKAM